MLDGKKASVVYLTTHQTNKNQGVNGVTINTFSPWLTSANIAAKEACITTGTFNLEQCARVFVKFGNANTASSPT